MSNLPAIIAAVAGLVVAITSLIGVIRHVNGPQHSPPASGAGTVNDSKNTGGTS